MSPALRTLILSGLALALSAVQGQTAWFRPEALPSEVVRGQLNCMYQDGTGLVWLGTGTGVYSYDGTSCLQLVVPGLEDGPGITALYEDAGGKLWIGYEDGTVLKHDGFGKFEPVLPAGRGKHGHISAFCEDPSGNMWISTYGSGAIVMGDSSFVEWDKDNGLSDNFIYSMATDLQGRIWMGTDDGINIFDPEVRPIGIKHLSIGEGLPDFIVQVIRTDRHGDIWIGMYDKGICRYDRASNSFQSLPGLEDWHHGAVRDMVILRDRAWIATSESGLLEYTFSDHGLRAYGTVNNCNLGRVRSMLYDREGNIWLMSSNELCLSFADRIEVFTRLGDHELRNIHALTIDNEDRLWFADDRGLFSYLPNDPSEGKRPTKYPLAVDLGMQKIMSLYRDSYGFVWIGTFGSGLVRLDPSTGRQRILTEKDGLVNGNVLSIAGNEEEVWFGTLGGASRCALEGSGSGMSWAPRFESFGLDEGLVNNYIYQVCLDRDGTAYFATDGNGVQVYRNGQFASLIPGDELSDKVVYSVARDRAGNTWMNVANEGLLKYDGQGISRISTNAGPESMNVDGIVSTPDELVISYDNGIEVLGLHSGATRYFEENAGVSAIHPDLNTLAIDSRNNVWIGTTRGIIRYRQQETGTWERPVTNLTGVALFLNPIDPRNTSTFRYNENHISFTYNGLWYQSAEKVEYLFKLEGHDLDWISSRNEQVIYSDLRPGQYTFRVKSGVYGNFERSVEDAYSFTISRSFWTTTWFYLLLVLLLAAVITLIFSIRVRQVKKKEEIIQEKIRFQFENLKSQINPHFLFNSFSTLIALIEDDPREAVNYVEELSILFRNILEHKDQELVSMEKELEIAENYINLQKKRFGSSLVVEIAGRSAFEGLKIPPLTVQLLIENAIKHNVVSRERPLKIKVFTRPGEKRILVENNIQAKKENAASTGIGLSNIVSRYRLLTKREVEVSKNGNMFTVYLPFIE